MGRMRLPSLSLHGIEGAFAGPGAKTVIPAKVGGKFSIRWVCGLSFRYMSFVSLLPSGRGWAGRGACVRVGGIRHRGGGDGGGRLGLSADCVSCEEAERVGDGDESGMTEEETTGEMRPRVGRDEEDGCGVSGGHACVRVVRARRVSHGRMHRERELTDRCVWRRPWYLWAYLGRGYVGERRRVRGAHSHCGA